MATVIDDAAEVGEELLEASLGGLVAFDVPGPPPAAGVVDKLLLDGEAVTKPGGVAAAGEEFGAGQDEVAFAGAFGGQSQAGPSSSSVRRKSV